LRPKSHRRTGRSNPTNERRRTPLKLSWMGSNRGFPLCQSRSVFSAPLIGGEQVTFTPGCSRVDPDVIGGLGLSPYKVFLGICKTGHLLLGYYLVVLYLFKREIYIVTTLVLPLDNKFISFLLPSAFNDPAGANPVPEGGEPQEKSTRNTPSAFPLLIIRVTSLVSPGFL